MNNVRLVLGKVDQVDSVLLGVESPFLRPFFAIINDNLKHGLILTV